MPDENETDDTTTDAISVSEMAPGVTVTAPATTTTGTIPSGTDWKAEADKQRAINRKLEADNKRNAAAAKRLQELEDKDKTDLERATARAEAAETRAAEVEATARERLAESAILAAAAKANANEPALVWMAAQRMGLDYDSNGRIKDPARVVALVLKEYPALAGRKATTEARDAGKPTTGTDMNALIRRHAGVTHQP